MYKQTHDNPNMQIIALGIAYQDQPGSIGPVVVNVNFWPSEIISACKIRPTSKGSGAYTDLVAPAYLKGINECVR